MDRHRRQSPQRSFTDGPAEEANFDGSGGGGEKQCPVFPCFRFELWSFGSASAPVVSEICSRVAAKSAAPTIIFIIEIDAVGRHPGTGLGGGNDEEEQTMNQIFGGNGWLLKAARKVIVIAATNRPGCAGPGNAPSGKDLTEEFFWTCRTLRAEKKY